MTLLVNLLWLPISQAENDMTNLVSEYQQYQDAVVEVEEGEDEDEGDEDEEDEEEA